MKAPGPAQNEAERLAFLRALKILDSYPEERFDNLTQLASNLFDAPVALISLVDENRQWFKSKCGLETAETPRDISFCGHVVETSEMLVIQDARNDERFKDNPLVLNEEHPVIFYAGAPLLLKEKFVLGTLCIIAHEPKTLSEDQRQALERLAKIAVDEIELRSLFTEANRLRKQLVEKQTHMRSRNQKLLDMIHRFKDSRSRLVNAEALAVFGVLVGNLDGEKGEPESLIQATNAIRTVAAWKKEAHVTKVPMGTLLKAAIDAAQVRYSKRLTVVGVEGNPKLKVRGVESNLTVAVLCILCSLIEVRLRPIRVKIRVEAVDGQVQCVFMSNGVEEGKNTSASSSIATQALRLAQGIVHDHQGSLVAVRIPEKGMRVTVTF